MGLFGSKEICSICNKKASQNIFKTADGWICLACFRKCEHDPNVSILTKDTEQIKKDIVETEERKKQGISLTENKMEKSKEQIDVFVATKKFSMFIEFDEVNKKFLAIPHPLEKRKTAEIHSFSEITEYELLEDGESVAKGGLGSAIVGGALFGGVGAVVGGVTGKRTTRTVVNSLKIKITLNNISNPVIYITFVCFSMKTNSFQYKKSYEKAQEILSVLAIIVKQNEADKEKPQSRLGTADEIRKFKELLNDGIITEKEFEQKKKQILEL